MKKTVYINHPELKKLHGDIVQVEFKGKTPATLYWRNKFKDAVIDKSVTLTKPKQQKDAK